MLNRMNRNCSMVAAAALALASPMAFAEEPDSYAAFAPLFADNAVLEVTIEAPIDVAPGIRPSALLQAAVTPLLAPPSHPGIRVGAIR